MKRRFSLILVCVMLFSFVQPPASSYAVGMTMAGSGTAQDPYIVTTADELNSIRDNLNASYKLGNDIDLSGYTNWNPIGEYAGQAFRGSFDGDNHTISGLTITSSSMGVGLFGSVDTYGTIKNVHLKNAAVKGQALVGSLIGYNKGTISNSSSENGTIEGTSHQIGGLIGANAGPVSDSHASGTIKGGRQVGGLIGQNEKAISKSYATGTVTGTEQVGGLVATNYQYTAISDSFSQASVTGTMYVGGLAGINNGSVKSSYSTGKVTGNTYVGGLVGFSNGGYVMSSYFDQQTSGQTSYGNGTPMTTADMQKKATFSGWDFSNTWGIQAGQYPTLLPFGVERTYQVTYDLNGATVGTVPIDDSSYKKGETVTVKGNSGTLEKTGFAFSGWNTKADGSGTNYPADTTFIMGDQHVTLYAKWKVVFTMNGSGTEQDPYIITTADELNSLRYDVTAHYKLGNDIDLSGFSNWQPIGTNPTFTGSFDGDNHVITGLKMNSSASDVGLFSTISSDGVVKNVILENVNVAGYSRVSSLAGINYGTISNSSLKSGTVTGTSSVAGGLVATNIGTISDSNANGIVTGGGNDIGGLVGTNSGKITKSFTTGSVATSYAYASNTGGLVGNNIINFNSQYIISDSFSKANVTGKTNVGGLIGQNAGGVTRSYAIGKVTGTSSTGGLIGVNRGPESNSFYDMVTTGQSDTGKGDALPTQDMQTKWFFVDFGWDFDTIWDISEGDYPNLRSLEVVKTYRVTYDVNSATAGLAPADSSKYKNGDPVTVKGNSENLVKTGYTFAGWNTQADGSGTNYAADDTFSMGEQNITLYVQWKEMTYTVSYDANGATGGAVPSDSTEYKNGDTITVIGNSRDLVQTGFVFDHWNTKADGSGTDYTADETFNMGDQDVTLYAQWIDPNAMKGSGTVEDPYIVKTAEQFDRIREDLSASYKLGNDIDLSNYSNWEPIGNSFSPFTGTLNGDGHVIKGLTIQGASINEMIGLFADNSGMIENVGLVAVNIDLYGFGIGALVGYNHGAILNSYVTGHVTGLGIVGGLAGSNSTEAFIVNSFSTATITGNYTVGGLVGENHGIVDSSYATGKVTGMNEATTIGGLIGINDGSSALLGTYISNSYAKGSVTGKVQVGGLVGFNMRANISESYAAGKVTGVSSVGGLVGDNFDGDVQASFYDKEATGQVDTGKGIPMSTVDMKSRLTFELARWDFLNIWAIDANLYPYLQAIPALQFYLVTYDANEALGGNTPIDGGEYRNGETVTVKGNTGSLVKPGYQFTGWNSKADGSGTSYTSDEILTITDQSITLYAQWEKVNSMQGSGTERDPFIVMTDTDFNDIHKDLTAHYRLGNDIDLSSYSNWEPIGTDADPFTGGFDGNYHTIRGLKINRPNAVDVGLFGFTSNGYIRNVALENVDVVGFSNVSALTGRAFGTIISNNYTTGNVSGVNNVSGLVAVNYGVIENSYSNCAVTGTVFVGGLVGNNEGFFTNSFSSGKVSAIETDLTFVGGLIGFNGFGLPITNSFYDADTTGQNDFGKGVGKTTSEMQSAATFFMASWNFGSVWGINAGGYPALKGFKYTVKYDANGAEAGSVPSDELFYKNGDMGIIKANSGNLQKIGYTFVGWNTKADGTGIDYTPGNSINMDAGNISLFARWEKKQYTVSFDANGGNPVASETVKYQEKTVQPALPTKEGYTFAGWYSDANHTALYDFDMPVTLDITLYADWTINQYEVSYDTGGGSNIASENVKYNEKATQPEAPIKEGYTFAGWYSDEARTNLYDFNESVKAATKLYAKWTHNQYEVNFDTNGGSNIASETVKYNEKAMQPEAPTKAGYTFEGWYNDAALTTSYDFDTLVKAPMILYAKWTRNQYEVSFESNGGDSVASQNVIYEEKAINPGIPTKEGYTFAGWYSDEARTNLYDFNEPVKAATKLYAKWTHNQYEVNFDPNGGSNIASETVKYNEKAMQPEAPTKEGYTFAGWYSDEARTNLYDFDAPVKGSMILYAKWTPNQYEVSFDSNGGSQVAAQNVTYKEKVGMPLVPTKEGYTFAGWYNDEALTNLYDFNDPVKAATKLYAKWTHNQYEVNFDPNGGSNIASETVKYNEKATQPEAPTKEGYTFAGWYSDEARTNLYDFDAPVKGSMILYAKWTPNQYEVSFDSNGGSQVAAQNVTYKEKVGMPLVPTKEGYTFAGWYSDEARTNLYDFNEPVKAATKLYAKWTHNQYEVNFDTNGGTAVASANVKYNEKATKPEAPTKEGYTFAGWHSDEALTTLYDFDAPVKAEMILYAKWTPNQYEVSFDSNGGSQVADQSVTYKEKVGMPLVPTKEGYTFAGWYGDEARANLYDFNEPVKAATKLYAKWTHNQYEVNFDPNGGSGIASENVKYNEKATKPTVPTKEGHTFEGWYSDTALTTLYDFGVPVKAAMILYAKWTPNQYEVSFDSNGGSHVTDQSVTYKEKVGIPLVPTKEGYTFASWYSDADLTTLYDFNEPVKAATKLYAKWTHNQYEVNFDSNGGSAVASANVKYNEKATQPEAPTKEGYTFAGWYSDEARTNLYDFDAPVKGSMILYAKWTPNQYEVSFDSNGGSTIASENVKHNEKAVKPELPTKEGYTFEGWFSNSKLTTEYDFDQSITADKTLYAKWTINEYKVSFDTNGGSKVDSENVKYQETAEKPVSPTKEGYTFAGWYSDEQLTTMYDFETPVTAATTLYAKWASSNSALSTITLSNNASLSPSFDKKKTTYTATVAYDVQQLTISVTTSETRGTVQLNGQMVDHGSTEVTVPLSVGENMITIKVTAPDGVSATAYTIQVTRVDEPKDVTKDIIIDVTSDNGQGVLAQTSIKRTTETSGKVKDLVTFTQENAQKVLEKLGTSAKKAVTFDIPDSNDEVSETKVEVPSDAIKLLGHGGAALQIQTNDVNILVPNKSILEFDKELYFRVVPVKNEADRQLIEEQAKQEQIVKNIVKDQNREIQALGRPMEIETNMQNHLVTIMMPLPTDVQLTNEMLENLAVFIQHSDGTKEVLPGKVVKDQSGKIYVQFDVTKFSTFTVMYMEGASEYFAKDDTVEIPDKEISNNDKENGDISINKGQASTEETDKTPAKVTSESDLPNTASNQYNWMLIGSLLVLLGLISYFFARRRKNEMTN
ncbi:InlB B-repeat-containing protein [Neobacillus jeddahensis]|uniref:InlB B-repeat-containing protein n=1 Tax=Neobacillus jeddahensis TaxID=1461580 RepID=UPI0005A66882|nr:InlB B-repeat-containing protein [Neobacillus jeddahensis]